MLELTPLSHLILVWLRTGSLPGRFGDKIYFLTRRYERIGGYPG